MKVYCDNPNVLKSTMDYYKYEQEENYGNLYKKHKYIIHITISDYKKFKEQLEEKMRWKNY